MGNAYNNIVQKNPVLIVIDSAHNFSMYRLSSFGRNLISIGRSEANDIILGESFVSTQQGCVTVENDRLYYSDSNSRNGSTVIYPNKHIRLNNMNHRLEITDGSIIRFGKKDDPENNVMIFVMYLGNQNLLTVTLKQHTTIGRSAECDVAFDSPNISRVHASIEYQNGVFCIFDNGSRNGVSVNGIPVTEGVPLKDKDVISIVGYQMIYAKGMLAYKKRSSGISIYAENINKYVGKNNKQILTNSMVEIKANEFVAIIGGSGAGKTTIMNVLNGFDNSYEGEVTFNGMPVRNNFKQFKSLVGYVPQEDIVFENLTLRRMLEYSAKLRMPSDVTQVEIDKKIDEVLDTLGLTQHQNTFIRKMSGGQKKRASIAVELLADPKLFFLDEPTSGLDPYTEKNLMQSLQALSKSQERTIVMVTHTVQNLDLCDKVLFMGKNGRVCFAGSLGEAKIFFGTEDLTDIYYYIDCEPEKWQAKYMQMMHIEGESARHTGSIKIEKIKTSAIKQFGIVVKRYLELMKNDAKRLGMLIGEPLLIGILLAIVVDKALLSEFNTTQSIMFAMSSAAIWVGVFNSIEEVCKERSILKREYMANLKLSVYLLSKVLVQMVLGLIQVLFMTSLFFALAITFKDTVIEFGDIFDSDQQFLGIVFTLWLTVLASEALGFVISSIVKTGDKAMAVAPIILIIQLLCSGILFKFKGASKVISYFAISKWSMEGLGRYLDFTDLISKIPLSDDQMDMYEHDKTWILCDWGILALMTVICIVASIILLRRVAKDGR